LRNNQLDFECLIFLQEWSVLGKVVSVYGKSSKEVGRTSSHLRDGEDLIHGSSEMGAFLEE
jgi:hypothetical protein